jgi:hypothetical protein
MKPLKWLALVLLLVAVTLVPVYSAGPPGVWTTDFTILNLENQSGTINITRYDLCTPPCTQDSGTLITSVPIAANGSYYYNPVSDPSFPNGYAGSIVVSADRSVAATVTIGNTGTGAAYASDAYSGVTEVSDSVFLPIIMGKLGVWNTRIAVQNAGGTPTTVTIDYIGAGAPADTVITDLPPYMTALVDQQDNAGMSGFNGSALVTSTGGQPLAVVVDEYKTTGGVLVSYVGVPSSQAAGTIYMPGFIAMGEWATDFTIVNTTGSAADVDVTFSGASNTLSGSIPANGSAYINGFAGVYPGGWTGSAPVSGYYGAAAVSSSRDVVVVYNISNSAGGPGNFAVGYVGFASTMAGRTVAVPLIMNHYSTGWDTTFSVQNVEGGTANLQMSYSGNLLANCDPCNYAMTSASHTFNQPADGHVPSGFIGGVIITSDKDIVVIGDQNLAGGVGDTSAGFPGILVP